MLTLKDDIEIDERLFQKLLALPYDLEIKNGGEFFVLTPRGHEGWTWEELATQSILPSDLKGWKVETNARRQILLMPSPGIDHQSFGSEILLILARLLPSGRALYECGVQTQDGTKEPDIVWASNEMWRAHREEPSFAPAPEICIEVLSPSNSQPEIEEKRRLYLESGAQEVWVCAADGGMAFFDADGLLPRSRLCPDFPARLDPFA